MKLIEEKLETFIAVLFGICFFGSAIVGIVRMFMFLIEEIFPSLSIAQNFYIAVGLGLLFFYHMPSQLEVLDRKIK